MKWKNVPPILLILWPYLIILSFLFPNEDMLTLFLNIYLLLTFPVYLLNILYTCTYKAEDALTHLAIWNMIIKLAHIPFYGLVFLLGACMMLTMVVPALALVAPLAALLLMIVDLLLMLTSSDPVSGGQFAGAVLAVVTDSPPETGASTPQGGGGG